MTNVRMLWRSCVRPRASEVVAAVSVTSTLILFLHTSHLQYQLALYTHSHDSLASSDEGSSGHGDASVTSKYGGFNLHEYKHLDPMSLNNTARHQKLTLMFNRVPKVGSMSTMALIARLSVRNGFTFHRDKIQKIELIQVPRREQKRLAQLVDRFKPPSAYVKHICYINFTTFNASPPIYINMVRDPVERVISWYYYVRAPWYFVERKQLFPELPLPSTRWLKKMDYETCVLRGDSECRYEEGSTKRNDYAQLTEFFCGQGEKCCGLNTQYALQKAKDTVERHYAVVGVLEDINVTLTVLQHYIPRFFANAKTVYWDEVQKFSTVNRNMYKPKVSQGVKDIVRRNFTREIEFYHFCRRRLYMQYAALNLPEEA